MGSSEGCCASGANSMSHLGGPQPTHYLPSPLLHSCYIDGGESPLLVLAIFISFDFANDDDFCLKSQATKHHWYAMNCSVCQQIDIELSLMYCSALQALIHSSLHNTMFIGCISEKRQGWHAPGCWQQGISVNARGTLLNCATFLDTRAMLLLMILALGGHKNAVQCLQQCSKILSNSK